MGRLLMFSIKDWKHLILCTVQLAAICTAGSPSSQSRDRSRMADMYECISLQYDMV
jgi:hypothetical protein